MRNARGRGGKAKTLTPDAWALLEGHAWPGNVRQLRGCVLRAAALGGAVLGVEDFFLPGPGARTPPPRSGGGGEGAPRSGAVRHEEPLVKVDGEPLSEKERASVALRAECRRVVAACKGNKSEAARQLGMSRNRLDRILGRSGSEVGRLGPDGRQAGS